MAKLPLEIIDLRDDKTPDLQIAIQEANREQSHIDVTVLEPSLAETLWLSVLDDTHTSSFFDSLVEQKELWRGFHPFLLAVVDGALHSDKWKNLFSARRAKNGVAIVTSNAVEKVLIPQGKMSAYYLHEIAVHVLALIVEGKPHHDKAPGCIYEFKEDKRRIADAIAAGKLCDECRKWFSANGQSMSSNQLTSVLNMLSKASEMLVQDQSASLSTQPRVFVGSSSEGLEIARAIQSELQHDCSIEIWNQNTVFGLGTATIEALEDAVRTYDYGVFIFTPDDVIQKRGEEFRVPRDNVIFELGLFVGKLSRFKAFAVTPSDVQIQLPSDIQSMTVATYRSGTVNLDAAVGPACRQIRTAMDAAIPATE